MTILLDTQQFVWALVGDSRLSTRVAELLKSRKNEVLISMVSLWEIAIKISVGKLRIEGGVKACVAELDRMGMKMLPLVPAHIEAVEQLPMHHRDPFDRMLIAQAKVEGVRVITSDLAFLLYDAD
ncbi:MAG: type II toxin-antitoxin system VapC family toxin, partial [Flavobacteriales bacterium]